MSRRMKVLVSILAVVLLLTLGGVGVVMADDEPVPEVGGFNGFIAKLAAKLGIGEQDLRDAIKEVQDEIGAERQGEWHCETPVSGALEDIGVDPQALREAFAQAMSEFREGLPDRDEQRTAIMARVAEILGVEQSVLEEALGQGGQHRGLMMGGRFGHGMPFKGFARGHFGPRGWGEPAPQND